MCKMGFYNDSEATLPYLEVAILLEDINLPSLPPFPSKSEIKSGSVYYPRTLELYGNIKGKFSIPILNPLSDTDSVSESNAGTESKRNIVNSSCNIEVSAYKESNYLTLTIPRYIALNFLDKIPKGTKFLVGFIGGSSEADDIKIVGVC